MSSKNSENQVSEDTSSTDRLSCYKESADDADNDAKELS